MTDKQRADLEAGQRSQKFNSDNSTLINTIEDDTVATIIAGVISQVQKVVDAEAAQQHDAGDVAETKRLAKIEMGDVVIRYALRGEVKAALISNTDLETALKQTLTYITEVDDVLSLTHANDIRSTLNDNKGPGGLLTNIVAGDITLIDAAIKAFDDIKTTPTDNVKEKKAQGTDKIQPEIDKLFEFIVAERKIFHSYWAGTANSGKMDEFDLKSEPIVLGKRHNIVSVTMLKAEDDSELTGALLTSLSNGKTSNGELTNVYTIVGIRQGLRAFKAEATGRILQEFNITIKSRTTVEVTIRMKLE